MMSLCWKYFVPIAFIDLIGTAVWVAIFPDGNVIAQWTMLAIGMAILVLFIRAGGLSPGGPRMELYFHPTI